VVRTKRLELEVVVLNLVLPEVLSRSRTGGPEPKEDDEQKRGGGEKSSHGAAGEVSEAL
jgi:hypothetical protein